MISVPVPDTSENDEKRVKADERVRRAIREYESRWVLLLPNMMILILAGLFLSLPMGKSVQVALMISAPAFCVVWSCLVWVYPVLRYQHYKKAGKIVEVRGRDAEHFLARFQKRVKARNARFVVLDDAVLHAALLQAAAHNPDTDSGHEQRSMLFGTALLMADNPDLADPTPKS